MASEYKQPFLIDVGPWWARYWRGMPEFSLEDLEPFQSVIVHFSGPRDREAFAFLVDQTITPRTKSLWYPEAEINRMSDARYKNVAED